MALLTKEEIFAVDDFPAAKTVPVPEWGGEVLIRAMSAGERDLYEQNLVAGRLGDGDNTVVSNVRARLLAFVIVDEDGERLFDEADIETLGKKSVVAVDRVFAAAQKMNSLTHADVKALEKNLESGQTGSSSST